VVPLEGGGALELTNERAESAGLVVRRAEVQEPSEGLADEPLLEGARDPGLADARLAREQHHAAFLLLLGLPPPAEQQLDLLLAANKRCGSRSPVQRLEPAFGGALAQHAPGLHRFGKALRLDHAKLRVVKETAGQALRAF